MTTSYLTLSLLTALIASCSALDGPPPANRAVDLAVEEMQRACYFTFVTLINMVRDRIASNTTFLMPDDRTLSNVSVTESKVVEFLSAHSIPSPLLFDDLLRLPSGTKIPTNQPEFALRISNGGRKGFYVNDVRVRSPNICTAGSSFRCHGIDGILKAEEATNRTTAPTCFNGSRPAEAAEPSPAPPQPSPPPLVGPSSVGPATSPPPAELSVGSRISDSSCLLHRGWFTAIIWCMVLPTKRFLI